jgi:hypothetical protein
LIKKRTAADLIYNKLVGCRLIVASNDRIDPSLLLFTYDPAPATKITDPKDGPLSIYYRCNCNWLAIVPVTFRR